MIIKMVLAEILFLTKIRDDILSFLQNEGIVHIKPLRITPTEEDYGLANFTLSEKEQKAKEDLEKSLKILSELPIADSEFKQRPKGSIAPKEWEKPTSQLYSETLELQKQFISLKSQKSRAVEELEVLAAYRSILESIKLSRHDLERLTPLNCYALIISKERFRQIPIFLDELRRTTENRSEVFTFLRESDAVILVFYELADAKVIDEFLHSKGLEKVAFPKEYLTNDIDTSLELLKAKEEKLQSRLQNLEAEIKTLQETTADKRYSLKTVVFNRLERFRVLSNLLQSKNLTLIQGWVPQEKFRGFSERLIKKFPQAVLVKSRKTADFSQAPIELNNPKPIKSFENLLPIVGLPRYGTFDATSLISIFFPLFFGLIVGDIGYGIILIAIGALLRFLTKKAILKSISQIIFAGGGATIIFGFLYGEFFGDLGEHLFHLKPIFHRGESIVEFLILVLAIGFFHIVLGFILGIIGSLKFKKFRKGMEKLGMLLAIFGIFLLILTVKGLLPKSFWTPSLSLLIVSIPIMLIGGGFLVLLETLSAIANILSYARLMALGLAGVMLAHLANKFGGMAGNIIVGVIIAGLVHILNFVLSVFSPTIQSLRLHYVEFFSKFYEPGGTKYEPFRIIE